MAIRKAKLTVSVDTELLPLIDRVAREQHTTRSAVINDWLEEAARLAREKRLDDEMRAYYQNMSAKERREQKAMARAASEAGARILARQEREARRRA
jgi:metal-responsive CopG/Arc/MetJ family transcriptional regulator